MQQKTWQSMYLAAVVVLGASAPAVAQQASPMPSAAVQRATFTQPVTGEAAKQWVRFGRQPVRVGEQMEQTLAFEVKLSMVMRRANEMVGKNQNIIRSQQRRLVTTTAVEAGRAMAVTVYYPESTKQIIGPPDPVAPSVPNASTASVESPPAPQPVQGKTYHCIREPGENGMLAVTDEAG